MSEREESADGDWTLTRSDKASCHQINGRYVISVESMTDLAITIASNIGLAGPGQRMLVLAGVTRR